MIFRVTEPAAAVTASTPAFESGVPSFFFTPMSAKLSAALTRPVVTPAPMSVESTPMVTDVPVKVTEPPLATVVGFAVAAIGTEKVEKVPVTPRHALLCVALAAAASGLSTSNSAIRGNSAAKAAALRWVRSCMKLSPWSTAGDDGMARTMGTIEQVTRSWEAEIAGFALSRICAKCG